MTPYEQQAIKTALKILGRRLHNGQVFDSPQAVKDYLCLKLGNLEHEVFAVMFLSSQHQMITFEEMFRGTLCQTSVYPREVVKLALKHNAGSVICSHNHPSGVAEPSRADEYLTQTLKTALAIIDVRVIDHIVVAGNTAVSFAETGRL